METLVGITAPLPYTVTFSQHPSRSCGDRKYRCRRNHSVLSCHDVSARSRGGCRPGGRGRLRRTPLTQHAQQSEGLPSQHSDSANTDVHQTVQRCSGWHQDDPKLKMCQIPGARLCCRGMRFIFSLVSHHELICMMHTGPLWEKLWVRQAGASRKTLTVSAHSFPAFFFSHIWPSFPVRILHHHYPFDLCPLLTGQSSSCLWHVEYMGQSFGLKYQTHASPEEVTLSGRVKGKGLNVTNQTVIRVFSVRWDGWLE